MKLTRPRVISYGAIALLAVTALRFAPDLPSRDGTVALQGGSSAPAAPAMPEWQEREDTLARGETLSGLFERAGLPPVSVREALRAAEVDARRVPAGLRVRTRRIAHPDSAPNEVVLQLAIDRLVRLRRTATGWAGAEERIPWTTDTIVVAGVIRSSLYEATRTGAADVLPGGARTELAWKIADIFEYRVDMSRDLREGDAFRAMVERETSPSGTVRLGNVLATSFRLSGQKLDAVRYGDGRGNYYDAEGKSLRAAFLRAPLEFRRISSVYGFRTHPILRIRKKHTGTDYAANSGTPVRAIGDGMVIRAGWGNGYGNVLEIRHRNGYVTRHAHLRGFAKGVRVGTRVGIGQTVAYVGSTGLSTAPHLHFEVIVGGVQRNPSEAIKAAIKGGDPVPAKERRAFEMLRDQMLASLDGDESVKVASLR